MLARYFTAVSLFKGLFFDGNKSTSAKDKRKHPEEADIFHCLISRRPYDRYRVMAEFGNINVAREGLRPRHKVAPNIRFIREEDRGSFRFTSIRSDAPDTPNS